MHTLETVFSLTKELNKSNMKNKNIVHSHEEARIYRSYYKPSFNLLRLVKCVLAVFISGSSPAAGTVRRK